jgi:putative aldouronate transport system substrate-binding protein
LADEIKKIRPFGEKVRNYKRGVLKMKRILSFMLVIALIAAMAGCASQAGPAATNAPAVATQAPETNATDKPADPTEAQAVEAPAEEELPVLKMLINNVGTDPNKEPPLEMIEERTGYKLDVYALPAENAQEKLQLDLANQVEYDLISLPNNYFYGIIGMNVLMPLDDLLAANDVPNIMNAVSEGDWKRTTLDGKILGIPRYDAYFVNGTLSYNTKLADDFGIDLSKDLSLDEFTSVLRAVKEKGIIPLTASPGTNGLREIASAFGIPFEHDFYLDNSVLKSKLSHPNMVQFLEYVKSLYDEGLLDEEYPVNTGEMLNTKFTSGNAFMAWSSWSSVAGLLPAIQESTGGEIGYINPIKDSAGNMIAAGNKGTTAAVAIPKYISQDKATHVLKYLNLYAEPENFEYIFIGEPGVQHAVTEVNGVKEYTPLMPGFEQWYNGHYYNAVAPASVFTSLWMCRVAKTPENHAAFKVINALPEKYWVNDPLNSYPPLPVTSQYRQSLAQFVSDTFIQFITGEKPISEYDSFVNDWLERGGQEVLDELASLQ